MLLTEEEAKKRRCPFAMASADNKPVSGNHALSRFPRNSEGEKMTRCIASECMAWRWNMVGEKTSNGGFCGLASPPQS